jgi:hypothetical protein
MEIRTKLNWIRVRSIEVIFELNDDSWGYIKDGGGKLVTAEGTVIVYSRIIFSVFRFNFVLKKKYTFLYKLKFLTFIETFTTRLRLTYFALKKMS